MRDKQEKTFVVGGPHLLTSLIKDFFFDLFCDLRPSVQNIYLVRRKSK